MSAREVLDISDARERFARGLALKIDKSQIDQGFFTQLLDILTPVRAGVCPVRVTYCRPGARAQLTLGTEWRVTPTDQMLASLKQLLGQDKVELIFE